MDTEKFVEALNEDLRTEYQSIVQYVSHIATVTGAEYLRVIDELKKHIGEELAHAQVLAEQVSFLNGRPSVTMTPVVEAAEPAEALAADLSLEEAQLQRYRDRVQQATDRGLPDVAEALRPLLQQTQEHVRDLRTALGK